MGSSYPAETPRRKRIGLRDPRVLGRSHRLPRCESDVEPVPGAISAATAVITAMAKLDLVASAEAEDHASMINGASDGPRDRTEAPSGARLVGCA